MTILVTGATGNIGRGVVRLLTSAGHRVRAMSREPRDAGMVYGDFERPGSWASALDGVDRVYLFSYAPEAFVTAAVEAGVRRFVTHSAAAAGFGDDDLRTLPALRRHLAEERDFHRGLEESVEASGADWTHVRMGLLAANALGWADRIRTEGVVREPYGAAGYPWVHEADVAEIAVAALVTDDHLGAAYTLTGPAKVSQREQVEAIAAAVGRDVRFEEVSAAEGRAQWLKDGLDEVTADWLIELLADAVDGCGALPPSDTYERLTGRAPRTFARWAEDHARDFG
jgi:uncharacterized protein YbjT (DUF2867 family)